MPEGAPGLECLVPGRVPRRIYRYGWVVQVGHGKHVTAAEQPFGDLKPGERALDCCVNAVALMVTAPYSDINRTALKQSRCRR